VVRIQYCRPLTSINHLFAIDGGNLAVKSFLMNIKNVEAQGIDRFTFLSEG
jgi:hypothetical protein